MIKVMSFLPAFVILFSYIVLYWPKKTRKQKRMASQSHDFAETCATYHEPFDTEKESLKLQEEREKQEPYLITLWWGFDGLRLNADGSTEWISRRKPDTSLQSIIQSIHDSEMQAIQIRQLEDKLQELQGKRIVSAYTDFGCGIDDYPDNVCEAQRLDEYYIVDDAPDFYNTPQTVKSFREIRMVN